MSLLEARETKQVTDALALDVTGGEQDWDLATWERMIEMRAVDIVQPDIMYMGGHCAHTARWCEMAAAAGLPCTPHSANLSLVTCAPCICSAQSPMPASTWSTRSKGADYYPWQRGCSARIRTAYATVT